jgi:hypothetical protein
MEVLVKNGAQIIDSATKYVDRRPSGYPTSNPEPMFAGASNATKTFFCKHNFVTLSIASDGAKCRVSLHWPARTNKDAEYDENAPSYESIHPLLLPHLIAKSEAEVSILLKTDYGLATQSVDFAPPVIDDLDMSYGTGFSKISAQIVDKLKEPRAGLMMFHGTAGVGKTTFIKHLTTLVKREFIFVPVGLAGELASPDFLSLLLGHKNAVLVLEDAEQALTSREADHHNSSTVATLLNLSDGLLGSVLQISIICSYNSDKQTIDKALLRKGRLSFDYTFGKLSVPDAKRLARHLGRGDPEAITEPASLADIYNADDNTGYVPPPVKTMGFGMPVGKS